MEKGIENIKLVLHAVVSAAKTFKLTKKPLVAIILNIGKFVKIKYKEIAPEIKDLSVEERVELVQWLTDQGFTGIGVEKLLANLGSEKRSTILNLAKDLLKTK